MAVAISGPDPKDSASRVRRHKDVMSPIHNIKTDGKLRGPILPKNIGVVWCDRTQKWWETWRRSPQAQLMVDTDWDGMLEAALIHNELWSNLGLHKPGEITGMTKELHRILSAYGMNYLDRLKLRIRLDGETDGLPRVKEEVREVPNNVYDMYRKKLAA